MKPITRANALQTIEKIGQVAGQPSNAEHVIIPPDDERQAFLRQAMAARSGKSLAIKRMIADEIERQRSGAEPYKVYRSWSNEFGHFGETVMASRPVRVNYETVAAGVLLDPRFGPPRAMPLEPNLRPLVMCIRIVLMQRGVRLAWY